jgi:16S rRNA (adenine1518-N6/adenine1519-N6)-dimethyltransferase
LGQHFLVDRETLARIVAAADVGAGDVVLEIGPGLGVLTGALADRARRVVAVEIDPAMAEILAERLGRRANLEVVVADILQRPAADFAGFDAPMPPAGDTRAGAARWRVEPGFAVVANLPYYITSAVLRHVLEAPIKPARAVVMVQAG